MDNPSTHQAGGPGGRSAAPHQERLGIAIGGAHPAQALAGVLLVGDSEKACNEQAVVVLDHRLQCGGGGHVACDERDTRDAFFTRLSASLGLSHSKN